MKYFPEETHKTQRANHGFKLEQFYRTFFNYFYVSTVFINEVHYNYAY